MYVPEAMFISILLLLCLTISPAAYRESIFACWMRVQCLVPVSYEQAMETNANFNIALTNPTTHRYLPGGAATNCSLYPCVNAREGHAQSLSTTVWS